MTNTVHISRSELTAPEVLEHVHAGRRVLIEVAVLGTPRDVTIRESNGTYYCETPTKLFTHETGDGLCECLETHRLVRLETADDEEISLSAD